MPFCFWPCHPNLFSLLFFPHILAISLQKFLSFKKFILVPQFYGWKSRIYFLASNITMIAVVWFGDANLWSWLCITYQDLFANELWNHDFTRNLQGLKITLKSCCFLWERTNYANGSVSLFPPIWQRTPAQVSAPPWSPSSFQVTDAAAHRNGTIIGAHLHSRCYYLIMSCVSDWRMQFFQGQVYKYLVVPNLRARLLFNPSFVWFYFSLRLIYTDYATSSKLADFFSYHLPIQNSFYNLLHFFRSLNVQFRCILIKVFWLFPNIPFMNLSCSSDTLFPQLCFLTLRHHRSFQWMENWK